MSLYRPTYIDKKSRKRRKQKIWWTKFTLQPGGPPIRRPTGQRDRIAAERRQVEIRQEFERLEAGIADPALLHRGRTLDDHVQDFEDVKRATDDTPEYLGEFMKNLRQILAFVPTRTLAGLHLFKLRRYLESDAVKSKARKYWKTDPDGDLSNRSINKRIKALKQFGRWLEDSGRIPKSPFRQLKCLNEETDPRRVRTVFDSDQFRMFLRAARRRPLAHARKQRVNAGVTPDQHDKLRRQGRDRALIYLFAESVGLRRDEIETLVRSDFDFDEGTVRVLAINAKARREDVLPLRSDVLRLLRAYDRTLPKRSRPGRFFVDARGRTIVPSAKSFKKDLEFAGISERNDRGEVLDFHGLRTTFVTNLVNQNIHPRKAQALARHAKLETTMKYYARVETEDLRSEVEKCVPKRERARTA